MFMMYEQELMANYNVPHYSPLDWFINMGYVPPEREGRFTMLDAGLPRDRRSKYKTPVSGKCLVTVFSLQCIINLCNSIHRTLCLGVKVSKRNLNQTQLVD